jgi:glycosyltransferase A (GT-A) superfamily protein (DUF2064 family)
MQLVVLATEPRADLMDGRLSPPWTLGQAAKVREAALAATLATVAAVPASRRVLALEGGEGPWLPAGFDVAAQRGGSLGNLLFGTFEDCFHVSSHPVVLIGMDTPQLSVDQLLTVRMLLETTADAVVGLTPTGGTWLIGLNHLHPDAFSGVPSRDDDTGHAQLDRLRTCGYRVSLTDELRELNDVHDAVEIASQLPGTRLADAVEAANRSNR